MKLEPGVLYIDKRSGSGELAPLFAPYAVRTDVSRELPAADFAWLGNHETGPVNIGVERKTLGDLCGSLLKSRLFGHQVPKLLKEYPVVCWILVEGNWRASVDDMIEVPRRGGWITSPVRITHTQLVEWLTSLAMAAPGRILQWRTGTQRDTVSWIVGWFRWWQKSWDKHTSHLEFGKWKPGEVDRRVLLSPTDLQRVARSWPEVGSVMARKIGRGFRSIHAMNNASIEELRATGLTKPEATRIYCELRRARR